MLNLKTKYFSRNNINRAHTVNKGGAYLCQKHVHTMLCEDI